MNQAPQPPTPEQIQEAERLDNDILTTTNQVNTLESAAVNHDQAAEAADQQAVEAEMQRSEVAAHAAALGVNAVVNAQKALSTRARRLESTKAERYAVDHPEASRQSANFRDDVGIETVDAHGKPMIVKPGRNSFWTGTAPQHSSVPHNQHEAVRARALGMEHENHYPWHKIEKGMRRMQDLLTRGPKRLRKVDPHEKQLETDYHDYEHDQQHHDGLTHRTYRRATEATTSGTRKVFRRGDPDPEDRASDHETVTVSDALALSADRIGQEVRYSNTGEALPDRVAHRKTLGWPGLLHTGQTSHIDIPGIAYREVGDMEDQLYEANRRRVAQGQAPLSFEQAYSVEIDDLPGLGKRLSEEDEALVGTGKHVHQLAFGEKDASARAALEKERDTNQNLINDLRTPRPNGPEDEDVQFTRYRDTLISADGATLRQLADIRQQRREVEAALRQPGLSTADRDALHDQLDDLNDRYERTNGVQLTRDQQEVARRGLRYADFEPKYQKFKEARTELRDIDDYIRSNGTWFTPEEHKTTQEKRDAAQQEFDTAKADFDLLDQDDFQLIHNVRGAVARRNEIIELDSRNRQIDIVLNGGIQHDPNIPTHLAPNESNRANRRDVLDYFTDTAQRQIDVAARRAAFDAMGPGGNDSLGKEAADLQKDYEDGMLLFAPVDGRRDTPEYRQKLSDFLGQKEYNDLQAELKQAKNGAKFNLIQAAIRERLVEIQRAQQVVLGEIRDHAVRQDGILNEERILLPGLLRAVAARPRVMRQGVLAQEEAQRRHLQTAQNERDEALEQRRRANDARRRLAQLQADRASIPV